MWKNDMKKSAKREGRVWAVAAILVAVYLGYLFLK